MDVILTARGSTSSTPRPSPGRGGDSGRSSRGHDGLVATLKEPRHGGANEDVLAMLHEIGDPARAEAFVDARLGARAGLSRHERAIPAPASPGSSTGSTRWTTRGPA